MRRISAWMLSVTAVSIVGFVHFSPAGAANVNDAEFKALLDQDIKIIDRAVSASAKATGRDKRVVEKNAANAVKSCALLIAGYANEHITGTGSAGNAKAAAIRDIALKMYKAAENKDFKAIAAAAKQLSNPKPAASAKKIDLGPALKDLGDVTQKEVMHNFLKKEQYGTNIEADIIANSKRATAKPADIDLMTRRLLIMGEYNKLIVMPESGEDKKKWAEYNDRMIKAAQALQATTKKKTSAANLAKVFTTLDSSCKACHDDFK